jgi:hypothetical protein
MKQRQSSRCQRHRHRQCYRQRQRGNTLIYTMLGLLVLGVLMLGFALRGRDKVFRIAGTLEGQVLRDLQSATNKLIFDSFVSLQKGEKIERNAVSGADPLLVSSGKVSILPFGVYVGPAAIYQPTWLVSTEKLQAMGYLPKGWARHTSSLNGGLYQINFRREPPGCLGADCHIEGLVILNRPVNTPLETPGMPNAVMIGGALGVLGIEGGQSLPAGMGLGPAVIAGVQGTWSEANPVFGQPAGLIAARLGNGTKGFEEFVRIGDTRDPSLQNSLSIGKNLNIGGDARIAGVTTQQGDVQLLGADGNPCVEQRKDGQVIISCQGELKARVANFAAPGATAGTPGVPSTSVSPQGVLATGQVRAREVLADQALRAPQLALTEVVEGAACTALPAPANLGGTPTNVGAQASYAALTGGGLAWCNAGQWQALQRFKAAGEPCTAATEGASAIDPVDQQTLICKNGSFLRTSALLSNFVLTQTTSLQLATGPVNVPKPNCPSLGSQASPASLSPEPLIILTPSSEDPPVNAAAGGVATGGGVGGATTTNSLSGINRFAVDAGNAWSVHLEKSSDNSPLQGSLIASVYCWYR